MAAYAAAASTTTTFETLRDAASAGREHKPSKNATQAYRDVLTRVWVLGALFESLATLCIRVYPATRRSSDTCERRVDARRLT